MFSACQLARFRKIIEPIAAKKAKIIGSGVRRDELLSAGWFRFIESVSRFDDTRNVNIEQWCAIQATYGMADYGRSMDHLTRTQRRLLCVVRLEQERLARTLHRVPSADEAMDSLAFTPVMRERFWQIPMKPVSLTVRDSDGDATDMALMDVASSSCDDLIFQRQLQQAMKEVLATMPPRYQKIIRLIYWDGHRHREVAKMMGVNESRISQIVQAVFNRARETGKLEPFLEGVAA